MRSTSRNIICEKQPFGGGRRAVFLCAGMGSFVLRRRVHYLSPTGIISRLRARDGAFRAPARVTFFCCQKKVTKENHLDLRSKNPLARGGQVQIWRCVLAGGVQRSSLSVKRTVPAFTGAEASATACLSHGRGVCFYRVGGVSPPRRRVGFPLAGRRPPAATFLSAKKEMWERKSLRPTV